MCIIRQLADTAGKLFPFSLPPGHASAPSLTWFNTKKALFVTFTPLLKKSEKILRGIVLQTKFIPDNNLSQVNIGNSPEKKEWERARVRERVNGIWNNDNP
jgi:hypothetical protein